jgi:hypothetical protein
MSKNELTREGMGAQTLPTVAGLRRPLPLCQIQNRSAKPLSGCRTAVAMKKSDSDANR